MPTDRTITIDPYRAYIRHTLTDTELAQLVEWVHEDHTTREAFWTRWHPIARFERDGNTIAVHLHEGTEPPPWLRKKYGTYYPDRKTPEGKELYTAMQALWKLPNPLARLFQQHQLPDHVFTNNLRFLRLGGIVLQIDNAVVCIAQVGCETPEKAADWTPPDGWERIPGWEFARLEIEAEHWFPTAAEVTP